MAGNTELVVDLSTEFIDEVDAALKVSIKHEIADGLTLRGGVDISDDVKYNIGIQYKVNF